MEKISSLVRRIARPEAGRAMAARSLPAGNAAVFLGRDPENRLHLLVGLSGKDPAWISQLQARSLKSGVRLLQLGAESPRRFVDIQFGADESSNFAAPFLGFAENFVDRVRRKRSDPLKILRATFDEWKHFWDQERAPFTEEWARGLAAELLFLEQAVSIEGPECALGWRGPDAPQDFSRNKVAFEVKSTPSVPHRPMVSSIDQLDSAPFTALYLVCVLLDRSGTNESLDRIVTRVAARLKRSPRCLRHFESVLDAFNYQRDREAEYGTALFSVESIDLFACDDAFPRITRGLLRRPLDERVLSVSYRVSLTGLQALTLDDRGVRSCLKKLGAGT